MRHRSLRLFLVATLAVASLAAAESEDWSRLAGLKAGDIVEVRQTGRSTVTGTWRNSSPDGVVLELAGADTTLWKGAITRISLRGETHRVRNAVIGGLVGGLAGAGGYRFGNGCGETSGGCHNVRVVTSAAAAAGVVTGILWPAHKTVIYRSGK